MKYSIFGARGFIGSALAASLARAGHEVYAPERQQDAPAGADHGHLIFCIGLTADFRTRPFDTMQAHVSVLASLLENTTFESFTYLSSTRVYARADSGRETELIPVDVNEPSDLYNISKLAGESLCLSCGRQNVRVVRLSNVYGGDFNSENFLPSLLRDFLQSGRISFGTSKDSAKDYISLEKVVETLPEIATRGVSRIYNLASGTNVSNGELAGCLAKIGKVTEISEGPAKSVFPPIDISRIRSEFGFTPGSLIEELPALASRYRMEQR